MGMGLLDDHEGFAVFDRTSVLNDDFGYRAGLRRGDLVHRLHRFDDEEGLTLLDGRTDLDEGGRAWCRRQIGGSDHRCADDVVGIAGFACGSSSRCCGSGGRSGKSSRGGDRSLHILHGAGTRHADTHIFLLDFDLGQIRLVENVGEIANQRLVDTRFLFSHWISCPVFLLLGDGFQRMKRQDVAMRSETADHTLSGGRDHRFVPEFFACVDVGDMHLHDGNGNGADCVMQRDRRVPIGTGVDGDAGGLVACLVHPVDQHAFVIALAEIDDKAQALAHGLAICLDILERLAAIDARLALAESVQIGSVEDKNSLRHQWFRQSAAQPIDSRDHIGKPRSAGCVSLGVETPRFWHF
ncbi:hypothetical protein RHSP_16040 [Rhizobium freirei PRF 81]|uniref:Uncharacterized protein n=1 Tax=Rhizobium freirei PRF 81 TaxID=363754 RepID=N6UZ26_9HYPH|nr:hypothetical protein RHSP_16040 [Rhizobium freirei PRF 81]